MLILIIFTLEFQHKIRITSSGPAAEKQSSKMGDYKLENTKTAQLRKVYKKTDEDFFIFYTSISFIMTIMFGSRYLSFQEMGSGWSVLI